MNPSELEKAIATAKNRLNCLACEVKDLTALALTITPCCSYGLTNESELPNLDVKFTSCNGAELVLTVGTGGEVTTCAKIESIIPQAGLVIRYIEPC